MSIDNISVKSSNYLDKYAINSDYKNKEMLYSLFYEITSEIKGTKIEIDEDEFQENINTITFEKLLNYVHEQIKILIQKKIEEGKKLEKEENEKINNIKINENEFIQYENSLRLLENKERRLKKFLFQNKLQREAMEKKISEYIEIEDEFEEMKMKFKYENGKFLDNDRKDNEIIILRKENTILKNKINDYENNIKNLENKINEKEKEICNLKENNENLKLKIEEKEKELNLLTNINLNYNNNNNNNNHNKNENIFYSNSNSNKDEIYKNNKFISTKHESPSNNIFHFQKINPNLVKKKRKKDFLNSTKHENSIEKNKLNIISKYFTHKNNNKKMSLNNSCIKIIKLPITNIKLNSNYTKVNKNNSTLNLLSKQKTDNETKPLSTRKPSNRTNLSYNKSLLEEF